MADKKSAIHAGRVRDRHSPLGPTPAGGSLLAAARMDVQQDRVAVARRGRMAIRLGTLAYAVHDRKPVSSPARQHPFTSEPAVITLPPDVPEYMAPAWFGMLQWAFGEPAIVERFEQESGIPRPSTSGINQMIDDACGLPEKYATEFAAWAHKNIWGPMDNPSWSGR